MTDQSTDSPLPLSDADLLAWAVVIGYRAERQRDGVRLLLLPFPPCPTCKAVVDAFDSWWDQDQLMRQQTIVMRPCGHAYTADEDALERIAGHIGGMLDALLASREMAVGEGGWTTDDIIREAQARAGSPQDGPHAPHNAPKRTDAGAETPDSTGGRQTGADGREAYRQLLARLQQERAKSLRNAPRCSLPDARWVNEGIAAGIRIAEAWAITLFEGHAARQVYLAAENEMARTTPDNGAASGNTADNSALREQYEAAVQAVQDGQAAPVEVGDERIVDAVMAVRDREMERLRAELADEQHAYRSRTGQWKRVLRGRDRVEELCRQLAAALTEVLAEPRIPDSGGETAVHIGPVKCAQVERWRGVLAAARQADGGPSVQEAADQDRAHWADKYAGEAS